MSTNNATMGSIHMLVEWLGYQKEKKERKSAIRVEEGFDHNFFAFEMDMCILFELLLY